MVIIVIAVVIIRTVIIAKIVVVLPRGQEREQRVLAETSQRMDAFWWNMVELRACHKLAGKIPSA